MNEATRALPRVTYDRREYFVNARWREFSSVCCPPETTEFVPLDSAKGRRLRIAYLFQRKAPGHADLLS